MVWEDKQDQAVEVAAFLLFQGPPEVTVEQVPLELLEY
jgi:hypothetical protein